MFKKKNKNNTLQLCEDMLKGYNISNEQLVEIKNQISSIIHELETIGHQINPKEIVEEVLKQNEIDLDVSQKNIEKITINKAIKVLKLTDEKLSKLQMNVNYSSMTIDLREFTFPEGELTIDLIGKTSGIYIYINDNIKVNDWMNLNVSAITYTYLNNSNKFDNYNDLPKNDITNSIRLQGDIKMSGIEVHVGHEACAILSDNSSKKITRKEKRLKRLFDRSKKD